jgi:pimeloyl-ACP methyl ester carboxylesterase
MRHTSISTRPIRAAMTLAIAAVLLGACSDDSANEATTDTAAVTTAAPTTQAEATTTPPTEPATTEPATTEPATTEPATTVPAPALGEDEAALASALTCEANADAETVVLLVHGTGSTPDESFGSGLLRTLPGEGYEVCTVALPGRAVGDIQVSAQYVVAAVRSIAADSSRPVALVGHSQGVLVSRWAMANYPDVAAATSMLVAIAGPNSGAPVIDSLCTAGCAPSLHQMKVGSAFLTALDSAWASVTVPVTVIRSTTDEFVPPESAAAIADAVIVTVQDVCADRATSHAGLLADSVAVTAVSSALTHAGAADPADLSADLCASPIAAGMDGEALAAAGNAAFGAVLSATPVPTEPPVVLPG